MWELLALVDDSFDKTEKLGVRKDEDDECLYLQLATIVLVEEFGSLEAQSI